MFSLGQYMRSIGMTDIGKADDAAIAELRSNIEAMKNDYDAKVKAVLGEEKSAKFTDYEQTVGDRRSLAIVAVALGGTAVAVGVFHALERFAERLAPRRADRSQDRGLVGLGGEQLPQAAAYDGMVIGDEDSDHW